MYLINFFCGFFVKLSSALAPPARPVRVLHFLFLVVTALQKQKNEVRRSTHIKKLYIYTYILRVLNDHVYVLRAKYIYIDLFFYVYTYSLFFFCFGGTPPRTKKEEAPVFEKRKGRR